VSSENGSSCRRHHECPAPIVRFLRSFSWRARGSSALASTGFRHDLAASEGHALIGDLRERGYYIRSPLAHHYCSGSVIIDLPDPQRATPAATGRACDRCHIA
jgi:hypothetical protein